MEFLTVLPSGSAEGVVKHGAQAAWVRLTVSDVLIQVETFNNVW